jgi:sigma-B regulation protein RsbU (phosphoserine phosphatase)
MRADDDPLIRATSVERLADAWLADGATLVEAFVGRRRILRRGSADGRSTLGLRSRVNVSGADWLEVRVRGAGGNVAQCRLDAETELLGERIRAEDALQRATTDLTDTRQRLAAAVGLVRATRGQLSLHDTLTGLVRELRRLTRSDLTFTVVPELGQDRIVCDPAVPEEWRDIVRRVATSTRSSGSLLVVDSMVNGPIEFEVPRLVENLAAVRVEIAGQPTAVLGLANQPDTQRSPASTLELLRSVADVVGCLMESATLYDRALALGRSARESELAADIQSALMPQAAPTTPGIDLAARFRSAAEVGGDFYDYVVDRNGRMVVFVGDVSGKGWPAAMVMTTTLAILRAASHMVARPSAVLERANAELYSHLSDIGAFVTIFAGYYDAMSARLAFANAGHSPVIYRARGGRSRLLRPTGLPLGILPDQGPSTDMVRLGPGDVLVVATDGFSEATSPSGELFGSERLLALVESSATRGASGVADQLFTTVTEFAAGRPQDDDQTLLVLKGK